MDILTLWQQNGMKKERKRYNAYLVYQNYHQIWEKNRMLTKRERNRLVKEIKRQLNKLISNH